MSETIASTVDSSVAETRDGGLLLAWRTPLLIYGISIVVLLFLYWDAVADMERIWRTSDTFQHCYLILPVVFYLLWEDRHRLRALTPRPSWWGGLLVLAGGGVWLLADIAHIALLQHLAVVGLAEALALTIFGWRIFWAMLFPMAYAFLMVPFGEFLVPTMQHYTAKFVVWMVELIGIPVYWDGFYIFTPRANFHVAKECSGIRYLFAMLAVGLLVARLFFNRWPKRLLAVAFAVIIPVVANWLRALMIVLVTYYSNGEYGAGLDHIIYGFWFFAFVMGVYILVFYRFIDDAPARRTAVSAASAVAMPPLLAVLLLAVSLTSLAAGPGMARLMAPGSLADGTTVAVSFPRQTNGWYAVAGGPADWVPGIAGADAMTVQRYGKEGLRVDVAVGYFVRQRDGHEAVAYGHDAGGETWTVTNRSTASLSVKGQILQVSVATLLRGHTAGRSRNVYVLYWSGGALTGSETRAKLHALQSRLLGGEERAAVIMLAADNLDLKPPAQQQVEELLRHFPLAETLQGAVIQTP